MNGKRVLITGGAGFVGSHVADELLERGYRVRALDNLAPQVHGTQARRPLGGLSPIDPKFVERMRNFGVLESCAAPQNRRGRACRKCQRH